MVVQHNMQSMNANRMLGVTTNAQAKSTEKLSSGYKINRAADDAAGLSISEKMRKQINGLDRASTNAQDGISAVQTAEGALTEVHSMLQRMNELAVQAANGTNSESDRTAIQNEIDQLTTEIDRVAETTKFNETYLLKGGDATKTEYFGFKDAGFGKYVTGTASTDGKTVDITYTPPTKGDKLTIKDKVYEIVDAAEADESNGKITADEAKTKIFAEVNAANELGGKTWSAVSDAKTNQTLALVTTKTDLGLALHVGAETDMENKIAFNIKMMDSNTLGIKGLKVDGADASNATYSIDTIAEAIEKVSAQRSGLGAIQNRLEHTIANVDNVVENTTAAESRIRDTDMASEMVTYSKNNILAQAGQSMLAQANQSTQGVMSLLG
ncbi:flagellin [Lachnospiraceae bacterium XBD2001]|nr:flagellin [Lachnospiraceae bacterium XBD2001]